MTRSHVKSQSKTKEALELSKVLLIVHSIYHWPPTSQDRTLYYTFNARKKATYFTHILHKNDPRTNYNYHRLHKITASYFTLSTMKQCTGVRDRRTYQLRPVYHTSFQASRSIESGHVIEQSQGGLYGIDFWSTIHGVGQRSTLPCPIAGSIHKTIDLIVKRAQSLQSYILITMKVIRSECHAFNGVRTHIFTIAKSHGGNLGHVFRLHAPISLSGLEQTLWLAV
jgi:hypothetical protein